MMKKDKKDVLVIASTYPRWANDSVPSFVQQFCYQLAEKYHMHALVPHYKGAKRSEDDNGVQVKRFRYAYPESAENIVYGGGGVFKIKKTPIYALKLIGFVLSEFCAAYRLAVAKDVKIINAHWIVPQGFVAVLVKLITRKKVVVSVHGSDVSELTGSFMTAFKRFVLKYADVVVVNSSATARGCRDICKTANIQAIPMGIDVDHFQPAKKPEELMKQLKLDKKYTILFIGRLTEVKGVKYLLEALKKMCKEEVDFRALIVGEGPEEQTLKEYVAKNDLADYVHFVGWVNQSDIVDYYNVADVLVGPSLDDALGLVFVEAQACGLPVIASNVGGIPDVVKDGETGFLVKRASAQDLYEKLRLLQKDVKLRARLAKAAPQKMSNDFSWDSVTKRYDQVFSRLVE